jgi:hypothetical protein
MPVVGENQGRVIEPPTKGVHRLVLAEVVDKGIVKADKPQFKDRHQGIFIFQSKERDSEGRPKEIWWFINNMTLGSADKPSNLRKFLEEWFGRPLNKEERTGLELSSLVGKGAEAYIKLAPGKKNPERTYAEITSIEPADAFPIEDYTPHAERKASQQAESSGGPADDDDIPF